MEERLVELNAVRAPEEARGLVRWLRPEFHNPQGQAATQPELAIAAEPAAKAKANSPEPEPWCQRRRTFGGQWHPSFSLPMLEGQCRIWMSGCNSLAGG